MEKRLSVQEIQKALLVCLCCLFICLGGTALAQSMEEATELTLEEAIPIELDNSAARWFQYTPAEDGIYRFASSIAPGMWINTQGMLYNSQSEFLTWNIDGDGFEIDYLLLAGRTYFLQVSCDESRSISTSVSVIRGSCLEIVPDGPMQSSADYGELWGSFAAASSGAYVITSENHGTNQFTLMDASGASLGDNLSFDAEGTFTIQLEAGRYYLKISHYTSDNSLSVGVRSFQGVIQAAAKEGQDMIALQPGESCTFETDISSTNGMYACQWYEVGRDGSLSVIPGATGESYTTGPVNTRQDYLCRVTDLTNSEVSRQIDVSFRAYIQTGLSAQDKNSNPNYHVTVQNNRLIFEVSARCYYMPELESELQYQWYVTYAGITDYELIEGATEAVFDPGYIKTTHPVYRCVVIDPYGNEASASFSVYTNYYTGLSASAVSATSFGWYTGENYSDTENITLEVTAKCSSKDRDGKEIIPSCQWYRNLDGTYEPIPGATGLSYAPGIITQSQIYRFTAEDGFGDHREVWFYINVDISDNQLRAWAQGSEEHSKETDVFIPLGQSADLAVETSYQYVAPTFQWYVQSDDPDEFVPLDGGTEDHFHTDALMKAADYRCLVSDNTGRSETWEILFHVGIENHLSASVAEDSRLTVNPGEDAMVRINASCDVGEDQLAYAWSELIRNDTAEAFQLSELPDITGPEYVFPRVDHYRQFVCKVTDLYGNSVSVFFEVTPENHLTAQAVPGGIMTVQPGDAAVMTVEAGCDDQSQTYEWYHLRNSDGELIHEIVQGATEAVCTASLVTWFDQYVCVVRDSYGNTVSVSFDLEQGNGIIAEAVEPVCWVYRGRTVTMEITARSYYNRSLSYHWYYEGEGGASLSDNSRRTLTVSNVQESRVYLCKITDSQGYSTTVPVQVAVSDSPIQLIEQSDDMVLMETGSAVTLSWFAKPLIGTVLHYQWSVTTDETPEGAYTNMGELSEGESGEWTTEPVTGFSRWRCEITDDRQNCLTLEWIVDAVRPINAYPVQGLIRAEEDQDATLEIRLPENETRDLHYAWYQVTENEDLQLEESGSTLILPDVRTPGEYLCVVSDDEGHQESISFRVEVIPLISAAPSDGNGVIIVGRSNLWRATLSVSASSLHNQRLTYQWFKGEEMTPLSSTSDKYYTNSLTDHTRYICRVSIPDGHFVDVPFLVKIDNNLTVTSSNIPWYVEENRLTSVYVTASCYQGTMNYQWYRGQSASVTEEPEVWELLPGKTKQSISFTESDLSSVIWYRCEVRDEERFGNIQTCDIPVLQRNVYATTADGNSSSSLQLLPDQTGTLEVSAYCRNGADPVYAWSWQKGGSTGVLPTEESGPVINVSAENAIYECLVTDGTGEHVKVQFYVSVTSGLTASARDNITDFSVVPGARIQLEVSAANQVGAPISYSWYTGTDRYGDVLEQIEGANASIYETEPITANRLYGCVVSDDYTALLVEFQITVEELPDPDMLQTIRLPASLLAVEEDAFSGLSSMEAAVIPESCGFIGANAFANCQALQYVYFLGDISEENISETAFTGNDNLIFICQTGSGPSRYAEQYGIPVIYQ